MTQKAPGVTGLCVRSPTIRYTICMIILTQPTSFRTLAAVYSKSQQISRTDCRSNEAEDLCGDAHLKVESSLQK